MDKLDFISLDGDTIRLKFPNREVELTTETVEQLCKFWMGEPKPARDKSRLLSECQSKLKIWIQDSKDMRLLNKALMEEIDLVRADERDKTLKEAGEWLESNRGEEDLCSFVYGKQIEALKKGDMP